ncbi:unnamed protein product [Blepharisma stoltei]|uniref:Uncharacterized protein n=1 Tax=Blepharisma stoltei TaxID=1481888 RepID=A0AAU9K7R3_9CILI|nr:unnamed protein product [Blepharisma stoltei]
MSLRPGSIINISHAADESGYSKGQSMKDWFKEERWKRVYDWIFEIEKELENIENSKYAKNQLGRIRELLSSIQRRNELKQATASDFYIEDLKRFNRAWDRNSIRVSGEKSIEEMQQESEKLKEDLERLERMDHTLRI